MVVVSDYEAIQLTDYNDRVNELSSRLNDYEDGDLVNLARYANSYDGSFDYADTFAMEDIGEYVSDPMEAARAVFFGNVQSWDLPVRFDAYGNLETATDSGVAESVRGEIDDLAQKVLDGVIDSSDLYGNDEVLVDGWIEYDSDYKDIAEQKEISEFFEGFKE